jgi:hypothetical protein
MLGKHVQAHEIDDPAPSPHASFTWAACLAFWVPVNCETHQNKAQQLEIPKKKRSTFAEVSQGGNNARMREESEGTG